MNKQKNDFLELEHTYMQLPNVFFSKQVPSLVPNPKLVIFNDALAETLGINEAAFKSDEGVQVLAGNTLLGPSIAQAYAGHQFGYFTMLGDGRAVLLGEYQAPDGILYDVQLKGSGRTPYSRRGDGKAALGPMLREYIISEGMYGLGIPTTRSLAVVTTGEQIRRETMLEGAILTRLAKSHIRVGTFQYAARYGTLGDLKALADYTVGRHFRETQAIKTNEKEDNPYIDLLRQVISRQAKLISKWQLVGFIHGVMNTDNMTISGETIDYGPCAFMDTYHSKTVFSSIDEAGRYAYGNQPAMAAWNLTRFAEALLPLLHENEEQAVLIAQSELEQFEKLYKTYWQQGICAKLGFQEVTKENMLLVKRLLELMESHEADYTNTFRLLTIGEEKLLDFWQAEEGKAWWEEWQKSLSVQNRTKEDIKKIMMAHNPVVIPRNHQVEAALSDATQAHDLSKLHKLLEVLKNPYDYSKDYGTYISVPKSNGCGYRTFCGT
ncbi:protein adenylyltransferase SelO [Cellulosilyticum ruminicola]|uniref:protein adenylyltransferase SelO n=1 Tax=Cellulosilyticum ruminicola TaxID=425254 RepID=UPI0006D25DF4|nr:YdiU family protein [Cellulosilyticum ruminicola]